MPSIAEKRLVPIQFAERALIPPSVVDFESFHDWSISESFPDVGTLSFCGDRIWLDISMEKYVHNQIKGKSATTLTLVAEEADLGEYVYDRMRLIHPEFQLSTEPDGMFFFHETRQSGKIELSEGVESLELIGTPDMTLEVVSATSAKKDLELLMGLYWQAGIAEYWVIDSRDEIPALDIYRHGSRRYSLVRKQSEWSRSAVFGRSFRLVQRDGKKGNVVYTLEVRQ